jgi:hypothetical protein
MNDTAPPLRPSGTGWPELRASRAEPCDGVHPRDRAAVHARLAQRLPPGRDRCGVAGQVKTRNVRDRRLRRWALRTFAVDLRNGVEPDGYDPRHVGRVLPWCVEAYLSRGPITPRMTTRKYRATERRHLAPVRDRVH